MDDGMRRLDELTEAARPSEDTAAMRSMIEAGARQWPARWRAFLLAIVCVAVFQLGLGTFAVFAHIDRLYNIVIIGSPLLSLTAGGFAIWIRAQRPRDAIEEISKTADVSVIGPLLDALEMGEAEGRRRVSAALFRLLPNLDAKDAAQLNGRQRAYLYRLLRQADRLYWPLHRDVDLVVALIEAMAFIGDRRALPHLERLAKSREERIRRAAAQGLPILRDRLASARRDARLLRPSAPAPLLRPAQAQGVIEPERLLRADIQAEGDE